MFDGREKRSAALFSTRKAHEGGRERGRRGKSASQNVEVESLKLNYAGFEVLLDVQRVGCGLNSSSTSTHFVPKSKQVCLTERNINSLDNKRFILILSSNIWLQKESNITYRWKFQCRMSICSLYANHYLTEMKRPSSWRDKEEVRWVNRKKSWFRRRGAKTSKGLTTHRAVYYSLNVSQNIRLTTPFQPARCWSLVCLIPYCDSPQTGSVWRQRGPDMVFVGAAASPLKPTAHSSVSLGDGHKAELFHDRENGWYRCRFTSVNFWALFVFFF